MLEIDASNEQWQAQLAGLNAWTWGLIYPSGVEIRETQAGYGLGDCPAGAAALEAIDPSGTPRALVQLQPEAAPVFYRQSRNGVSLTLGREWQENHDTGPLRSMSATVYGQIAPRPDSNQADYRLYAVVGGRWGDCPEWAIDADELQAVARRQRGV